MTTRRQDLDGGSPGHGSLARIWDRVAGTYDAERERDIIYMSCLEAAVSAAVAGRGSDMALDVGCGTGMATLSLARHFKRVTAVDFSRNSLDVLKEKIRDDRVVAVQANIRDLPFPDGRFDMVFCANTLQHVPPGESQHRAVKELFRVAKKGARIVVSVHHYSRGKRKHGWIKEGRPGQKEIDYVFRFTRAELASLLPTAHISAIGLSHSTIPFVRRWMRGSVTRVIGPAAARLGFGHMLLAVATRE